MQPEMKVMTKIHHYLSYINRELDCKRVEITRETLRFVYLREFWFSKTPKHDIYTKRFWKIDKVIFNQYFKDNLVKWRYSKYYHVLDKETDSENAVYDFIITHI